jgi:CMP-N-acetylneuraminic acid synthetase
MKQIGTIAIIPARSGSKGLEKKNIRILGGKPLVAWSIEAALACPNIHRVVVSTDSEEFAEISRKWGADVPFLRPSHLSNDSAKVEDAMLHAIKWIEKHEARSYEIVVLLQTTDVFRNKNIVDEVVSALVEDPSLDTAFAATPDFKNYWRAEGADITRLSNHDYLPRQVRTPLYREDTGVALATRTCVIRTGNRIGERVKIISHENLGNFVDIHTEFDLWLANVLIDMRGLIPNTL